jgi:dethiobiotin synthetase
MSACFITGTGTGIGKTWLTCALLRYWRAAGRQPAGFKPVLSGFDAALAQASDADLILQALGRDVTPAALEDIAPWRFVAPLAPDMAAAHEGRTIDFDALVGFTRRIRRLASADSLTLIEGVGGVMVPLDERHTVRDWIVASGLPCVLVAGSYLGSLSHTLTALEALQKVPGGEPKWVPGNQRVGADETTDEAPARQEGAGQNPARCAVDALRDGQAKDAQPCRPGLPLRGQGLLAVADGVTAIVVNESPGSPVALADTLASLRCHVGAVPLVAIARAAPQTGVAELAALLG